MDSIAARFESRESLACTVFQGKIVLSGGCASDKNMCVEMNDEPFMLPSDPPIFEQSYVVETLNSAEAYDFHKNKWSSFPSMLSPRASHTQLASVTKSL